MTTIAGIQIPDSMMAREATQLVRDTETELLYHHSRRVFLFGSLARRAQAVETRRRVAVHQRYISRHGARRSVQQRA